MTIDDLLARQKARWETTEASDRERLDAAVAGMRSAGSDLRKMLVGSDDDRADVWRRFLGEDEAENEGKPAEQPVEASDG